jgi:GWxTD domain-containing protein
MYGLRFSYRSVVALVVAGVVASAVAVGQPQSADTLRFALAQGAEAVRTGEEQRAVQLLEPVFVDTPSYADSTHGAAAYWLGRALAADDRAGRARSVLRAGVMMAHAQDRSNPRLSDAFIQRVFSDDDAANYELAVEAYRRMLQQVGAEPGLRKDREVLARHLQYVSLLLPEATKREVGLPPEPGDVSPELVPSVDGQTLLAWWRGQDPLPATKVNERLRAHLRRVAHAREHYAHPETPIGLDERGEVYIRLGPPDHTVEINFDESRLTDRLTQPGGVTVTLSDFPENEFWSYGQFDRRTYYIFVEKRRGDPLTIGTIEDLLPRKLRNGFGRGVSGPSIAADPRKSRGRDRAMKALATLRTIYRQYAPFHPDMAVRHDEVANYIANYQLEEGEMQNSQYRPGVFIQKNLLDTRNLDAVAAMRREKNTPQQLGPEREKTAPLEVAVRTARFLKEDGTTRTEVLWAPERNGLLPTGEQREQLEDDGYESLDEYVIRFTAIQKTPDYRNRAVGRKQYRVTGIERGRGTIPARTFTTKRGDSTLYHLGLQWDQYLIDAENGERGPKVKVAATQQDSMRPLVSDESVLEMSDLKPMILPEEQRIQSARPYPFRSVGTDTPLALYFEVYHLPFDADDRTRYTVEYEIEGRRNRGAIAELFTGDDEERTTVSTTREGSARTAEEYILLDLSKWEEETDLTVTVRVTDEITGQEVTRSVDFRLRSTPDE